MRLLMIVTSCALLCACAGHFGPSENGAPKTLNVYTVPF